MSGQSADMRAKGQRGPAKGVGPEVSSMQPRVEEMVDTPCVRDE